VTVQVSKYTMGNWHSEDFTVRQGEVIGKVVESKPVEAKPVKGGQPRPVGGGTTPRADIYSRYDSGRSGQLPYDTAQNTILSVSDAPQTIDYGTGAVLVDVVPVNDWSGGSGRNMFARHYFDMLYSFDGTSIEHMPIDTKYWAAELRTVFGEIQNLQKEPREPLRPWGTRGAVFKGIAPASGYREEDALRMEEMMMEEMMKRENRERGRY
ncbi:MAG: hypothetical protein NTX52_05670, partial [Planctomycetota bacterium]|nr:hypothetical protein [Planctomycetota bacterium]